VRAYLEGTKATRQRNEAVRRGAQLLLALMHRRSKDRRADHLAADLARTQGLRNDADHLDAEIVRRLGDCAHDAHRTAYTRIRQSLTVREHTSTSTSVGRCAYLHTRGPSLCAPARDQTLQLARRTRLASQSAHHRTRILAESCCEAPCPAAAPLLPSDLQR